PGCCRGGEVAGRPRGAPSAGPRPGRGPQAARGHRHGRYPHRHRVAALPEAGMSFLLDPEFWARLLGIVLIDISLAGDNALVIALAVRDLPPRQQLVGRLWGTLGAVGLRVIFIAVVSFLLRIPLLQLVGGLALIWIAVRLVRPGHMDHAVTRHGTSLREAIWIIIVADVTMSLDNVLGVAAAAKGDIVLVIFGVALSLPLVVWGSGLLARLMARYEWIIWIGGGVLGFVAGEMMANDPIVERMFGHAADAADQWLSIVLAAAVTVLGWRRAGSAAAHARI